MWISRHRFWLFGFFLKAGDPPLIIDFHDPKIRGLTEGRGNAGDGEIGSGLHVGAQDGTVIHGVDVVTGEDEDIFRLVTFDDVHALMDGIGGAFLPSLFIAPVLCVERMSVVVGDGADAVGTWRVDG